jgi:uncharacterized protein (DUF488 family)
VITRSHEDIHDRFTNKKAQQFFDKLRQAGVKRIVDVRLNNVSQLAGFSKKDDLKYFLDAIAGIDYLHIPELAPTKEMLDAYKKHKGNWRVYENEFLDLMAQRRVESSVSQDPIEQSCLLCSEYKPHHCHRRLVAEYFQQHWPQVSVEHL